MHKQGEYQVKIGVTLSQAKELPEDKREAWSESFPGTLRGGVALQIPRFQISSDMRLL